MLPPSLSFHPLLAFQYTYLPSDMLPWECSAASHCGTPNMLLYVEYVLCSYIWERERVFHPFLSVPNCRNANVESPLFLSFCLPQGCDLGVARDGPFVLIFAHLLQLLSSLPIWNLEHPILWLSSSLLCQEILFACSRAEQSSQVSERTNAKRLPKRRLYGSLPSFPPFAVTVLPLLPFQ